MDFPITKKNIFNTALPVGGANLWTTDITPGRAPGVFRIYITPSIAGVLSLARTSGGVTVTELLNAGTALVAGAAYIFSIVVNSNEYINLRYSTPVIGATTVADVGASRVAGSVITLTAMTTTCTVTVAGTFTITLAAGLTGTAVGTGAGGQCTLTPATTHALVTGVNTIDTGITTGTFVVTLNGGSIKKLQIDETWN
jgi:hypothetical protein